MQPDAAASGYRPPLLMTMTCSKQPLDSTVATTAFVLGQGLHQGWFSDLVSSATCAPRLPLLCLSHAERRERCAGGSAGGGT